jgi:hypothetical protein
MRLTRCGFFDVSFGKGWLDSVAWGRGNIIRNTNIIGAE